MGFIQDRTPRPASRRILSDCVRIAVLDINGNNVNIGEFDSFSATHKDTLRTFRPVGELAELSLVTQGGWELSFSGGKIDWKLARLVGQHESYANPDHGGEVPVSPNIFLYKIANIAPLYSVEHTTMYYDGSQDTWIYEDVTLYNYSTNVDGDLAEVKESIKGYAARRKPSNETFILDDILAPLAQYHVEQAISKLIKERYTPKAKFGPAF